VIATYSAFPFLLSSILKRGNKKREFLKKKLSLPSLQVLYLYLCVPMVFLFSRSLSLFRFWDFLLLLLLRRLIRRSLERKRETKRQREREFDFSKLFLSPGKKKTFKRSKNERLFLFLRARGAFDENTERERTEWERTRELLSLTEREREDGGAERERERIRVLSERAARFFFLLCFLTKRPQGHFLNV